jgi:hypothetical protein
VKPYFVFAFMGVIIYLGIQGMVALEWISQPPTFTLEILLFLLFITALIYRYLVRFSPQGPEAVTRFYLLSIALKLIGGCTLIAAIIVMDNAGAGGNVILFLSGYALFTAAEIVFLLQLKKS